MVMPTGAFPSSKMVLPITEKPQRAAVTSSGAHPAFYIASWIFFSNLTILFNKWLIDSAGFRKLFSLIFAYSSPACLWLIRQMISNCSIP